jgi:hypothetical protein
MNKVKIVSGKIKRSAIIQSFNVEINGLMHTIDVSIVDGKIESFYRTGYGTQLALSFELWEEVKGLISKLITPTAQ